MEWISWALLVYLDGMVAWNLMRGQKLGDQLTAGLVLLPFLLRIFWIR